MPLPTTEQATNPASPTSSSSRSLLSPTENLAVVANVEVDNVQHQDGATAATTHPSYSSMAAKTVANIKRLQVNKT
jgi:hypothetical protein